MGFEPTTLRDLVGCSNHLSYWRLYGEQGPICGSPLEPHHAVTQPSNDWYTRSEELTNSIALTQSPLRYIIFVNFLNNVIVML